MELCLLEQRKYMRFKVEKVELGIEKPGPAVSVAGTDAVPLADYYISRTRALIAQLKIGQCLNRQSCP